MIKSNVVYIAGPLYTPAERIYLERIEEVCTAAGFKTYLPHRDGGLAPADGSSTRPFFESDIKALDESALVVAVLNGTDVDSGTAWEMGYAYALQKPVVGIFEDTRIDNPLASLNLMVTSSTMIVGSQSALRERLRSLGAKGLQLSVSELSTTGPHSQVSQLVNRLKDMPLDLTATSPDRFGHETAVLCVIDAVLSINRPYRRFVVPRLERFRRLHSTIDSLDKLRNLVESMPGEKFAAEVLNYKDLGRVNLLRSLVDRLHSLTASFPPQESESAQLRSWAKTWSVADYKKFGVKGIGLATFQYLRMLFGADTVKPDVHLQGFVSETLGRHVSALETINLIESAARSLNVTATALDHAIWLSRSGAQQSELSPAPSQEPSNTSV